jgi:CBS domain-containing protein
MKAVKEIMTSAVKCVAPDQNLAEAARLIGKLDIGALLLPA